MANVIARCVRLDQIPERYKSLPLVGRGATSVVLAKGEDRVIMLTRDQAKMEWLRDGAEIADHQSSFETRGHHIRGMDDVSVHVLELPRLKRLAGKNVGLVRTAMEEFEAVRSLGHAEKWGTFDERAFAALDRHFSDREDSVFYKLIDHLRNYDANWFKFDLDRRNFMEDTAGRIVIIDPIISTELADLIHEHRKQKAAANDDFSRPRFRMAG